MTTGQQQQHQAQQLSNGYNYQDYVPTEGIVCPICTITCTSLQNLNRVSFSSSLSFFSQLTQHYSI
jgi:hypothetical protein